MQTVVRIALIATLICVFLPTSSMGQLLTCTVSGTAVPLRAEGLSEPIGDVLIQCLANGQAPAGQSYLTGDVKLYLNTGFVNRTDGTGTTDVVLVINENSGPPSRDSTLGGPGGNVPLPQFGKQVGVNGLEWGAVKIPIPGATALDGTTFPTRTTLRITNMRCNAFELGVSTTLVPTQVTVASISIADSAIVQGTRHVSLDALILPSLLVQSTNGVLPQCQSQNIVDGSVSGPPTFIVNIQEGLADDFRPLGQPTTDGAPHSGEDGYPTPGIGANGGGANQGTRFLLRLAIVPPGVRIAVPVMVAQGMLTLQLTQADVSGNGSFSPVLGNGLIELQSVGGTFSAVYEVIASDGTTVESVQIPVTVGYTADVASNQPGIGQAVLSMSFAPLSFVGVASTTDPIPRFGDTSILQNAFSINQCQGAPPSVSGVSPGSVAAGLGIDLTIQVSGANFGTGAVAECNGSALSSSVLSSSALSATVPANLLMQPGSAQVDVLNPDGQRSNAVPFTITGSVGPSINSGGVVNAASSIATVARGSLATIYGTSLSTATMSSQALPLSTRLATTMVLFNGNPAPLVYISPTQINFQVPFEAATSGNAQVTVAQSGSNSPPVSVSLAEFAPGVFHSGDQPIVVHSDGSLVTFAKPAQPDELLVAYGTGVGGLNYSPVTGSATPSTPLVMASVTPTITVGGQNATVLFAGLTPGLAGLAQFNFQMPSSPLPDSTLALVINFSGSTSSPVNLPVGKPGTPIANVQVTFNPNPVTLSSLSCSNATSCWNYSVQLKETNGVGVTLTKLTTGGTDETNMISAWFGSTRIMANGVLTGSFTQSCGNPCNPPIQYVWQFGGTDDNGHNVVSSGAITLAAAASNRAARAVPRSRRLAPNQ